MDDAPAAPPLSGAASPLVPGGNTSSAGVEPMAPPPAMTPPAPPVAADVGGMELIPPPPAAPPLAPPPVVEAAAPPLAPPPPAVSPDAVAVPAQTSAPVAQPAVAAAPSMPETPRPARIEGGRVNVRAGPNTQYESIAVLTTGSPITVLAKHGDWYKIVFPADQLASIHKSVVAADITGEIPEAGLPGVVNQDNANVHAFYWDKSTVVGMLPKGAPVIIKQERGQWYRIDAPETARAYVFGTYVRIDGNQEVAVDAAPAPVNPAVDLTLTDGAGSARPVKMSKDQERVLEIKEAYYKRLRERFDAEQEAEEAAAKAAAEAKKLQGDQLDSALKDLESRLAVIDQEKTERIDYVVREFMPPQQTMLSGFGAAGWAPPDPAGGGYTGWVENIGRVGGAPTPFRLTKGGEIRYYLVSNQFNLDEFTNRRVWLNGQIDYAGGASASVMRVDQIRILTELEIADGMQQQMAGTGIAPAPAPMGMDPYAGQQSGGYDMGGYGVVTEYGPTGQPMDPMYGQQQPYVAPPAGTDPFAGYGTDYGQPSDGVMIQPYIDPNTGAVYSTGPGTADMVVAPGQVYTATPDGAAGGMHQAAPMPMQMPANAGGQGGGMSPSDPSQLPDVVGAGSQQQYYDVSAPAPAVDVGGGMSVGEVDTDRYERPIINEIAP
jgi:SH3-like domain-containing protein